MASITTPPIQKAPYATAPAQPGRWPPRSLTGLGVFWTPPAGAPDGRTDYKSRRPPRAAAPTSGVAFKSPARLRVKGQEKGGGAAFLGHGAAGGRGSVPGEAQPGPVLGPGLATAPGTHIPSGVDEPTGPRSATLMLSLLRRAFGPDSDFSLLVKGYNLTDVNRAKQLL
ncbi:uncharacterized protein LOC106738238 [Alligator mississippiensis]|uniref:uncharacterized protein LOC106738238 n=1 Tax=Alligator mississippiensis TaxID=8496 RepID=UPI00287785C8|nr:uncharacterized protein LOC106738238 [Alligator mississippiensis]